MKKRETSVQNIAFIAIVSAINAVLSLLSQFIPVLAILIIFLLPLITALTVIYCKKQFISIYIISTLIISALINMANLDMTIFTILPALVTGVVFGIMSLKRINAAFICISAAFFQFLLSWATIPLITALYSVNMFDAFGALLNITDKALVSISFLPFIYAISLAQSTISYIISSNELKKFNIKPNLDISSPYLYSIAAIVFCLLSIIFALTIKEISYLFFAMSITFVSLTITNQISKNNKTFIISISIIFILNIFLFAASHDFISSPYNLLSFNFFIILTSSYDFISHIKKKSFTNSKKCG